MPEFILGLFIIALIALPIVFYLKYKANRDELRAVYDSVNSVVIQLDRAGNYISINCSDDSLLAESREQLLGKNLKETFDADKARFFQETLDKCFQQKQLVEVEYPLITQDGKTHWFVARIAYKNDNMAILNAIDITDKIVREKQLVASEQRLKKTNEIKDKFFSIIAHDLKGPIGTFSALLDFFSDEFDHMSEVSKKEVIQSLLETSDRTGRLLDNLLNWSLSQSDNLDVKLTYYRLSELGSYIQENYEKAAHLKNITLQNDINESIYVKTDRNILEAIIRNLVSNAIKYSERAGTVVIKTEASVNERNRVKLVVADSGIGMSQEQLDNLFRLEKSISTPGTANEQGTGLGLVLCKEFAKKLGTTLIVESKTGNGTRFSIELEAC